MNGLEVRAAEAGIVRVFHLDLPPEAAARFTAEAETGEWPVKYALGASALRADFVDLVSVRDLGPMPLSSYLAEAHGVSGRAFDAATAELDALSGHVVILPSAAFDRTAQTLAVRPPLRFVGAFSEADKTPPGAPVRSASARGQAAGGAAPAARRTPTSPLLRALAIVVLALLAGVAALLVFGAA